MMDQQLAPGANRFKQVPVQLIVRAALIVLWIVVLYAIKTVDQTPMIYLVPLICLLTCFVIDPFAGIICGVLTSAVISLSGTVQPDAQIAVLAVLWGSMLLIFVLQQKTEPDHLSTVSTKPAPRKSVRPRSAAELHHDLRTPLNLIIGFCETMLIPSKSTRAPLPAAYRDDLEAIYRNAQVLNSLVNELSNVPHLNTELMTQSTVFIDPAKVIHEAAAMTRNLLGDHEIDVQIPGELPGMHLHRTFFRQMVLALLQYMAQSTPGRYAAIQARIERDSLLIRVSAAGTDPRQIAPQPDPKVPNAKLTPEEDRALAFPQQFAASMGGQLWADGIHGEQRTFYVSLPTISALGELNSASQTSNAVLPKLVIVGENKAPIELFRQHAVHCQIVGVSHLEDITHDNICGLIITNTSGQVPSQLLPEIDVPIICCDLPSLAQLLHRYRNVEHLVKPVTYDTLSGTLARHGTSLSTVLIIDDHHELVQMFSQMLGTLLPNCQILKAYSAQEGLALFAEQPPDLLIVDLHLPDLDGLTVIDRVRRQLQNQDIPILLISGTRDAEAAYLSTQLDLTLYQRSGISPEALVRAIDAFVTGS